MKKLFKYLKPYWFAVIMIVIFVAVQSVGQLLLPDFTSAIIKDGINVDGGINMEVITKYGLLMLGVTLLSGLAMIAISYFSSVVSTSFGRDIRKDIFKKVSEFSIAESEKFGTSTLITRSTNDVMQVQMLATMSFRMILAIPILLIGGIILSLRTSVKLTSILLGGIPALIILVTITFILVIPLFKAMQKKIDKLTVVGREAINGVRVIRAFGQGEKEVKRFKVANDDLIHNSMKAGNILSMLNPIVTLIFNFVVFGVVVLAFTIIHSSNGAISDYSELANLYAVIQYVTMIMFSIIMLTITFINYPRAEVSGKRITEILETPITIKDDASSEFDNVDFQGNIEFKHVSFKYADAEKNVLEDISFKASVGETIAIIGSTGSGKSTVINLLPRLFDVTEGEITIDGINVRQLKLAKLRNLMGFVPQKATLFTGTISENIAYGKQDATLEEIKEAAKIAQADEFIEAMPDQFESVVEQGGVNYSGGQKQRISIARAIVRRPKIYIFDDSFSALDFKTDAILRKKLKSITQKSTVLIVAQRIGTIMDADRIIVLQDGKIVGNGPHKELIKSCEVYREIALSQLSEEELS